ncbi:MAG TPA: DUF3280 domain-containing protein [Methylocella sp.]|nr:DUF3280 domain-containing protein [Methylocella sp.]
MKIRYFAHHGRGRRFSLGTFLFCAVLLPAFATSAGAPPLVKLAVFDFELEDFSAGAQLPVGGSAEADQLKLATNEARQLIAQSGHYSLVDVSGADAEAVKAHGLRKCNGCDAAIARKLGADQSLIGVITRISRTEYTVGFQIRDTRDGAVIITKQTDLRMGADYSWSREAAWLIKNRLLNSQDQP